MRWLHALLLLSSRDEEPLAAKFEPAVLNSCSTLLGTLKVLQEDNICCWKQRYMIFMVVDLRSYFEFQLFDGGSSWKTRPVIIRTVASSESR